MARILLIMLLVFGIVHYSNSQVVELIGEGVINADTYSLEISNPETVDHVIVEATAIFSGIDKAEAQSRTVTFSNTTGDTELAYFKYTELNYGPSLNSDSYHTGYFTAAFNDVSAGKIFLDKSGLGNSIISFTAYVHRIGSLGIYNTTVDDHAYVYHNGAADPVTYNFTIPVSEEFRDIVVKLPFTNLESNGLRWANVKLIAGSKSVSSEFQTNSNGDLLRLETLVLTDVPGDITEISLEIYSRKRVTEENDGDSFITGPAVLYTTVNGECGECEGQITSLELKYLGTESNATVNIYKDKVDKKKLLKTFTGIDPGDKFTFTGTGKHNKMGAKIRLTVNDNTDYTEIHTSCSEDIFAGMIFENEFLIISGESHEGGLLCYQENMQEDCGECEGQITALALEYTGIQTNAKVSIYKDKVESKKLIKSFLLVNPGDVLSFNGVGKDFKMGAKIRITINDDNDYTEIHTSCSKEIYPGMTFDNKFVLVSGESHNGGPLCYKEVEHQECGECEGQITALDLEYIGNESDATIGIYKDKVEKKNLIESFSNVNSGDILSFTGVGKDLKMGAKIRITVNDDNDYTEIHTSCSKEIYAGMKFENKFLLVSGESHEGGPLCYEEYEQEEEEEQEEQEEQEEEVECGECDGEITALGLGYLGIEKDVTVKIYKDNIETKNLLESFANVNYGDVLSFAGDGKDNKMGAKILITVNENQDITEIFTGCSQNIYVGMTFGNRFLIVSGRSHEGGPLCYKEYEQKECSECDGQITALDLEYLGSETNAMVRVYKDKVEDNNLIQSFSNVNPGDILSFTGVGKDLKMGVKIHITINDSDEYTEINTSGSHDIYVGMAFDHKFLIVSGESHKGGPLCDWNVKTGKITSLYELTNKSDLTVYPNPVSNKATVLFTPKTDGKATIDLYNSMGQKVSRLLDRNVQNNIGQTVILDAQEYAEGLYILVVQNDSFRINKKIQIIK